MPHGASPPTVTKRKRDAVIPVGKPMVCLAVHLPAGVREIGPRLIAPLLRPTVADPRPPSASVLIPPGTTLADAEWLLIDVALKDSGYNRARAPRMLGIGERTLRRKRNES